MPVPGESMSKTEHISGQFRSPGTHFDASLDSNRMKSDLIYHESVIIWIELIMDFRKISNFCQACIPFLGSLVFFISWNIQ